MYTQFHIDFDGAGCVDFQYPGGGLVFAGSKEPRNRKLFIIK
jgi:hypothetical protein